MKTAQEIGAKMLATLAANSARQKHEAMPMREDIRAVWLANPKLKAHEIRSRLPGNYSLTVDPLPSVRRVQEIIREIKSAEALASRLIARDHDAHGNSDRLA